MSANQSAGQVMGQIGEFFKGLTTGQRLLLLGGAVAVVATLVVFVRLIAKPDLKPLYSNLEPAEAQSLVVKLKGRNVEAQVSADGRTVMVPADRLDAERLEMASSSLPHSGRLGFELFDRTNWSGSDFSEKVNYQRALEGELERTIQTIAEVQSARVHLVLPQDSIFADRAREAKASVILKLRGHRLPPDAQATLARLVAGAVERLRPENVTIVDAETGRPLGAAGGAQAATGEQEQQLAARLVQTLDPVVGAERVRATVRLEFDQTTTEEREEKFDPAGAVPTSVHKREEELRNQTAGGVPGAASNLPAQTGGGAATRPGEQLRTLRSEDGAYAINRTERRVVRPAGQLRRLAAAIVVDDFVEQKYEGQQLKQTRRRRTPEEMKQIEELARAAVGYDEKRGDVLTVQNLAFQQEPVAPAVPPSTVMRVRTELNRWADAVRYGVIALLFAAVYLALLRPVKRQMMMSFRELAPADGPRLARVERAAGGVVEATTALEELPEPTTETQRIAAMKRRIVDKVKAEPASATRLVQAWLQQEEEEV